jgi:hypothetical protein
VAVKRPRNPAIVERHVPELAVHERDDILTKIGIHSVFPAKPYQRLQKDGLDKRTPNVAFADVVTAHEANVIALVGGPKTRRAIGFVHVKVNAGT